MTAAAAEPSGRQSLYGGGMAVRLAGGLVAIAFTAVLPDAVAYI